MDSLLASPGIPPQIPNIFSAYLLSATPQPFHPFPAGLEQPPSEFFVATLEAVRNNGGHGYNHSVSFGHFLPIYLWRLFLQRWFQYSIFPLSLPFPIQALAARVLISIDAWADPGTMTPRIAQPEKVDPYDFDAISALFKPHTAFCIHNSNNSQW